MNDVDWTEVTAVLEGAVQKRFRGTVVAAPPEVINVTGNAPAGASDERVLNGARHSTEPENTSFPSAQGSGRGDTGQVRPDERRRGIIDGFWRYYRLSVSDDRAERLASEDCFWAWEAVREIVAHGDLEAVGLIIDLADAVDGDSAALAYLGAGPMEDLLRHGGPPTSEVADALDSAACQKVSVRTAIGCVWWSDDDREDLRARFTRFGPPR